ncbi:MULTISPECIES: MarR family winged helix-turn-helix transcriptional regulator [Heyndrickxia]|jgi:DNA-binding MarR family transcriptional regulator|uniref:MarR family transcriptional regulator n=1 Tax=Heyndrickxia oleronia TaxID=38875 RepID=A0A8E2I496_9BACI|nr:MarR family transcriptional regulator [Heyndrickxia oleronia]OJH16172.1 MarR family transcriptional regulator [Bacillus obstructivus]MBU5212739.1 MarR family transcriptional regulator [Heyndrickxia oleronia]MCI1590626.1 MarR family transcriptional regulator [Heyndrickxia oleronia]MCI1614244.1 MarR family transcriptional regulator [Heyndrickxia oleronia]MCI1745100.1 MarR family transcriptional regulator [Heyndrickxia oleronia]
MNDKTVQLIEYEIALLVRLTTAHSPRLGSLDRAEYLLLSQLQKSSPIAINALAEQLLLNLSTASRQIAVLEKKGYIKRFPDPINGRISLIELTEKGSNILKKVQDARSSAYTEMLNEWSPDELIQLKDSLTRLNQDFKKWRK